MTKLGPSAPTKAWLGPGGGTTFQERPGFVPNAAPTKERPGGGAQETEEKVRGVERGRREGVGASKGLKELSGGKRGEKG